MPGGTADRIRTRCPNSPQRRAASALLVLVFLLATELLELGEDRIDVEVIALLGGLLGLGLGFRRSSRDGGRQQRRAAILDHGLSLAARCTSKSRSICVHR